MKRVLFVSGYQVHPPQTGGHIRAANVIAGLAAAGCEVRAYALSGRAAGYNAKLPSGAEAHGPGVSEYVNRRLALGACQSLSGRLKIPAFWETALTRWLPLPKSLAEPLAWCDTVMINHSYLYPLLARATGKTRVLLSHNLEQNMWPEFWWQRHLLVPAVRRLERRAGLSADLVLCCAPDEEVFYKHHARPDTKLIYVPNAIFPDRYRRDEGARVDARQRLGLAPDQRAALFVGSRYGPNRDGLEVLKAAAGRHGKELAAKGLVLLAVGSMAPAPFRMDGLIATGFVDDVLPYFQAADLSINPIARGSGTNVKVFEYLASRLPVISTAFGVRGFDLEASRDFFQFDGPDLGEALAEVLLQDVAGASAGRLTGMAQSALEKNRSLLDMEGIMRHVVQGDRKEAACASRS